MQIYIWRLIVLTAAVEAALLAESQLDERRLEADWRDIGHMLIAKTETCISKCIEGSSENVFTFLSNEIGGYCCTTANNSHCLQGTYSTVNVSNFELKKWMCVQNDPGSVVSETVTTESVEKGFTLNLGDQSLWEAMSATSESTIKKTVTDYQKFKFKLNSKLQDANLTLSLKVKELSGCKISVFKIKNYSDSDDGFKIYQVNPSNVNQFSYLLTQREQQQGYNLLAMVEPTDLTKQATFEIQIKVGKEAARQQSQEKT